MTTWVFFVLGVVFSVVCGKRGHLAVEAHNLANSIIPVGVAVSSKGDVFVSDYSNRRLVVLRTSIIL